jgi:hypothetical protein
MDFKRGTFFYVSETMRVSGLISWNAPTTTGFEGTLPKGTILVKLDDDIEGAIGAGYLPIEKERFEREFVPERERTNEKYSGYYVVIKHEEIGKVIVPLKNGIELLEKWGMRPMLKRSWLHRLIWGDA